MRTHKEIFTEIYEKNIWGGSGGGSSPENTVEYRALLQKFLKDHDIKTVVDYGCGDWSFSKLIDWSDVLYVGMDCVESVVEENFYKFGSENIKFLSPLGVMVQSDLLILKDVLQHWSNKDIDIFLRSVVNNHKYILITNTSDQKHDNQDIVNQMRPLSAKFEPLKKYNPQILATIHTTETKEVSLITT